MIKKNLTATLEENTLDVPNLYPPEILPLSKDSSNFFDANHNTKSILKAGPFSTNLTNLNKNQTVYLIRHVEKYVIDNGKVHEIALDKGN